MTMQLELSPDNSNSVPGFRFQPTQEELLGHLERKVKGIPPEVIPEATVYEVEPWKLPAYAFDGVDGNVSRFRLTTIKKKNRGGDRVDRRTGRGGKWNVKSKKAIENSQGTVIGYVTYLVYQIKEPSSSKWTDTRWRMHEYRLPFEQYSSAENEWVLCKITSKRDSSGSTDHCSRPQQNDDYDGDGDIGGAEGQNGGLEMGEREFVTNNPQPTRGCEGETVSHDPFGVYVHGSQATYVQRGETDSYSFSNTIDCDNQLFSDRTFSRSLDDNRFLFTMNQLSTFTKSKWGCKGKKDKEYEAEKVMNDYSTPQLNGGELSPSFFNQLMNAETMFSPGDITITMDQSVSDSFPGYMDEYSGHHQMPQQSGSTDGHPRQLGSMDGYYRYHQMPQQLGSMDEYFEYYQLPQQSGSMDEYLQQLGSMDEYLQQLGSMDEYFEYYQLPQQLGSMDEYPQQLGSMDAYFGYHQMPQQSEFMDGYPQQLGYMDGYSGYHQMPQQLGSVDGYTGYHRKT